MKLPKPALRGEHLCACDKCFHFWNARFKVTKVSHLALDAFDLGARAFKLPSQNRVALLKRVFEIR